MAVTPWVPTVVTIQDGQDVSAETVNPVLAQYTQREQHLYEKINELQGRSVLIAYDLPILVRQSDTGVNISVNDLVYYNKINELGVDREGLDLAKVDFILHSSHYSSFGAGDSSYTVGLVKSIRTDSKTADIYLLGLVTLDQDIDDATSGLLQPGEGNPNIAFDPGPLYLSRSYAGKLTRNPGGIAVFVGYAFDRRTLLLSPNVNELSQLFTTYRYNVLDRPAGIPSLTNTTWTINSVDQNVVGWIPIASLSLAMQGLAPANAKFYYQFPTQDKILLDTGITYADRLEQIDFEKALPPNPPNLTLLTVNGVIQDSLEFNEGAEAVYSVNEAGLWWLSDQDGGQPWASNINPTVDVAINTTTNAIALANHGFSTGEGFKLTASVMPTSTPQVDSSTEYYVATIADGGHFTVSTTSDGSNVIDFTTAGTSVQLVQPYIWKAFNGTVPYRLKIALQFVKLNPALGQTVVTSLSKYNPGSEIIRFFEGVSPSTTESTSGTGDLFVQVLLKFIAGTPVTSSSTAIKSLAYSETNGVITFVETPIVSQLATGTGLSINPKTVGGVIVPGSYILTASSGSESGRVSSIEPDGAELLYVGLHSYLNMTLPSAVPSSFIGKILLPIGVPAADLKLVILLSGSQSLSASPTAKEVDFQFSYAVTKPGGTMSTTPDGSSLITFNMPDSYARLSCIKIGAVTSPAGIPVTGLAIPASAFSGNDAAVNFKLERTAPSSGAATYAGDIGIIDIYWKIG